MNKAKLAQLFKIEKKRVELSQLEKELQQADFWQKKDAKIKSLRYAQLKKLVDKFDAAKPEDLKELKKEALFSEPYDKEPAILSISAGTGGVDACDCAQILERMYLRFAEKRRFKTSLFYRLENQEAGIKSAIYKFEGENAYGWLKSEQGAHRIVRKSPFNSQNLRQTSFVLVEVLPEIENPEMEIEDKDLKIETFRSSGHGGQSVNTTDSAVRITHLPTKTSVSCQNERSQFQNKEQALKILKARLLLLKEKEREQKKKKFKGNTLASWGRQIRSYIFDPYKLVKDHRTHHEEKDIEKVLDGNLDLLIEAYLKSQAFDFSKK